MTVTTLIEQLQAVGIELDTDGIELSIDAPKGALTPELVKQLKANKQPLIDYLCLTPIIVPMTEIQRDMWVGVQLDPKLAQAYNLAFGLWLTGPLQIDKLRLALNQLIKRHDALRTRPGSDGMTQEIYRVLTVELPLTDLSQKSEIEQTEQLDEIKFSEVATPFDLSQGVLFRAKLVRVSEDKHLFLMTIHHLISDGWSLDVITSNLAKLYSAACKGEEASLPKVMQFSEFIQKQTEFTEQDSYKKAEAYWLNEFADSIPILDLPSDQQRPLKRTFKAVHKNIQLDATFVAQIKQSAAKQNSTMFAYMMTAFHVLLYRLSGMTDIVVGVPVAGQVKYGNRDLVGDCVNFIPIRLTLSPDSSFADMVSLVTNKKLPGGLSNQDYSMGTLLKQLPIKRDLSRMPLISVVFNSYGSGLEDEFYQLSASFSDLPEVTELYDIYLDIIEEPDGYSLSYRANADLFDEAAIDEHIKAYFALLHATLVGPEQAVSQLSVIDNETRQRIIVDWNQTEVAYDVRPTPDLIQKQAEVNPDAIALRCGERTLSYEQLDTQSNLVAHYLKAQGVTPNTLVGLGMGRSLDMVVALLGIWKAGGAYVPLDPAYPEARLLHMVNDSGMALLITETEHKNLFDSFGITTLVWEEMESGIEQYDATPLPLSLDNRQRAYVIYTSGSTGLPKGVQVPHQALTNFLWSMQNEPGLSPEDVLASVTTLSFDIHGLELWLPLITGAEVVIVTPEISTDGLRLAELLDETGTTAMQATPATWKLLLESGWNGRSQLKMMCGGEPLPSQLADQLLEKGGELWNMYGPTETTIWSSIAKIEKERDVITIGKPIANTQMYVLDNYLTPVPIGTTGLLYIGGDGITLGYLNRDELTRERFIENPFGIGQIYNTGDLARYRMDGQLECLGRIDSQVKVRGFRIELGEIDAQASNYAGIEETISTVFADANGDNRIVSYYRAQKEIPYAELRDFLSASLPYYMIPSVFVKLDSFPLTPNGKIDRRALPEPDKFSSQNKSEFVAPQTEVEIKLAEIWSDILETDKIGIHDDFFELGGHSLLATRVINQTFDQYGVRVSLLVFFESSTIESLSTYIEDELQQKSEDVTEDFEEFTL